MFIYVFCDGMKFIQGAIRLPFAWPYVDVIMGLWLLFLSEKPSSTSRFVGQQIAKTVFKFVNFYTVTLYLMGGEGGEGSGVVKNTKGSERGS